MQFIPTNREYKNVKNGEVFRLYTSNDRSDFHLIKDEKNATFQHPKGTMVNGFYICGFSDCTIKINNKKEVFLPIGTFYHLNEGEEITHKKLPNQKRFVKN